MEEIHFIPELTKEEIKYLIELSKIRHEPLNIKNSLLEKNICLYGQWARHHDILPQFICNLDKTNDKFIATWRETLRRITNYDQVMETVLAHNTETNNIMQVLNTNIINCKLIKGQNLQNIYNDFLRYQRDIDLLVKDISDGWKVLHQLLGFGYVIDKIKLGIGRDNNGVRDYFLISLRRSVADKTILVDLHIGEYPICGFISVKSNVFFDNNLELEYPIGEILILCAHIAQHWRVKFRDINDLYLLLKDRDDMWWKIIYRLKKYNLDGIFLSLYSLVNKVYGVGTYQQLSCIRKYNHKYKYTFSIFGPRRHLLILIERLRFLIRGNKLIGKIHMYQPMVDLAFLIINNKPWFNPINNRSFKIYQSRVIQPLLPHRQIALDGICQSNDSVNRLNDFVKQEVNICNANRVHLCKLSENFYVAEKGTINEFFITPIGFLTQCGYSGKLNNLEREHIEKFIQNNLISKIKWEDKHESY